MLFSDNHLQILDYHSAFEQRYTVVSGIGRFQLKGQYSLVRKMVAERRLIKGGRFVKNVKPIHILRYGTVGERMHLDKAISAYDYLSINGNTAAYVSSAIAKFIVEKFFDKSEKGFFIDPITYAFQYEIRLLKSKSKPLGKENIKKSINKLIEVYGAPITHVLEGKPIVVSDFNDIEVKMSFCERVLSFQYDLVYNHIKENDLQKYLDYIAPDQASNIPQLRPKFLIAPYFYLDAQDPNWSKWLELNVDFACRSVSIAESNCGGIEVFAQIVMSKSMLSNDNFIEQIATKYNTVNCKGFTIWIDDFNEKDADLCELKGFVKLLSLLNSKPVYNMYGGYFSILLTHKKLRLLSGVSHGLEYGESRQVYPVGGGIPVSKYYYMPLHQRLDFTKAYYLLEYAQIIDIQQEDWGSSEKYFRDICKCEQCKTVIGSKMINFVEFESREFYEVHRKDQTLRRKKASPDTKQNCLYHYLLCKKREFLKVSTSKLEDLLNDLVVTGSLYSKCEAMRNGELNYTMVWRNVLQEFVGV